MSDSERTGGLLIRAARDRAGLTQQQLAGRAGTTQSMIADYERGRNSPTISTLQRILLAAGFELRMRIAPYSDHDEWLARVEARLTPEQRRRFKREQTEVISRGKKRVPTA